MTAIKATLLIAALLCAGCGDDTPTTPITPTRTSPVTETFISNVTVKGSVRRFFTAIQTGPMTATLTTSDQPSTVIAFAIGLRDSSGTGCLITKDVITTAGSAPQLSAQVDAGTYCVRLADTGTLTTPMNFTITLTYP